MTGRHLAAILLVGSLLLAACAAGGSAPGGPQPPRDGRAGIQMSGTFSGRQLAVSDGSPDLLVGRCAQQIGIDAAVCFASRDIDGTPVTVVLHNPAELEPGTTMQVGGECRTPEECQEVTGVAVVDVQVGQRRQRATSGTLTVRDVVPGTYYSGALVLRFRDGRLSGGFDVVPRPED